jgi:hypothetical protein
MSETPHSADGARGGLGLSTLVAAGVCAGMLSLAVLVPPREGGAAVTNGLVDRDGWSRLGSLERQELSVDIVLRAGERRYTVRRGGSIVAERLTADELLQRWGIDARSLRAEDDGPGAMMMVDPDAAALIGR